MSTEDDFTRPAGKSAALKRDTASECRDAHSKLDSFFDFVGYSNARKRSEWASWATGRILAGWTSAQVQERDMADAETVGNAQRIEWKP